MIHLVYLIRTIIESLRQEQAQEQKEAMTLQKKIRDKEKTLDKKKPDSVKAKEEASSLERRIKENEEHLKRCS